MEFRVPDLDDTVLAAAEEHILRWSERQRREPVTMRVRQLLVALEGACIPTPDRPVTRRREETASLAAHCKVANAIVVRRRQCPSGLPGRCAPHLHGSISASREEVAAIELGEGKDAAAVSLLQGRHGSQGQEVPDADGSILGAGHEQVGSFEYPEGVDLRSMTEQRLGRGKGFQTPDFDGLVLGTGAKQLPRHCRHEALHESAVPR
mmetsp:Transcript_16785/g.36839  ORF Transcript_16785/g.36839 Transcript_16785/m.36839 type:complete len:207 (+) Transcript_16785:175-795(+)